jgi:predicted nucleotide-binding protein
MRDDLEVLGTFLLKGLNENGGDLETSFSSATVARALDWDAPRLNRSMNALSKRGWLEVDPALGSAPFAARGFEVTEEGLLALEDEALDAERRSNETGPVSAVESDKRLVFIIHGRNVAARNAVEQFVRSLGLEPLDFDQVAADLGGSPFVGEVVRRGLELAHGIVALFTPDEFAALDPALRADGERAEDIQRRQSRPNVLFEAGMAFGMSRERTVLVTLGREVSLFSDAAGIHTIRLDNHVESRKKLRQRLIGMKCAVVERADGWTDSTRSGDFEACISGLSGVTPRDPFAEVAAPVAKVAAKPRGANLSEGARAYMLRLGRAYVDAGHPNHKVWQFDRGVETPVHSELMNGFGLIKLMGTRGAPYTLTDHGQAWILAHKDEPVAD